ncbi:MAG: magnesium transporter [Candidatus Latescibacterota bacterium]|nr:MAG: magnesium transporter [Candidatus Latescibacterota bacterium]
MAETSMAALAGLFRAHLQDLDWASLRAYSQNLHPADIAEAMHLLEPEEKVELVRALDTSVRAEVVSLANDSSLESLLDGLENNELAEIVEELPADDAADLLGEMDRTDADAVLRLVRDVSAQEEVQELLAYAEDSAGGIMDTDFVAVRESAGRDEIVTALRARDGEDDDLHELYVVDDHNRLVGKLPLLRVLLARDNAAMRGSIQRDLVRVDAEMDQEQVAGLFAKYDLVEAPVVGPQGRLLGRITVDDVIDVIEDEASEDLAMMAGTREEEIGSTSVFRISRSRFRWLLLGMVGGMVAAFIMGFFEADFAQVPAVYFFVPVITAMGGNIGIQSSTVVVRALATREVDVRQIGSQVFREIRVAILNATLLIPFLFGITWAWRHNLPLAILVGLSMLVVFLYSALVGALVPMLLARRGIDPAIATGPFITTSNDIIGVCIYLGFVSLAVRWVA